MISFLPEPEHTWCYYFEKAELARQQGDWNRILALIDEARSLGYHPEDPFEWLAYIEAQARTGDIQAGIRTSEEAYRQETRLRKGLCELWRRVQTASPADNEDNPRLSQVLSDLQCGLFQAPPN